MTTLALAIPHVSGRPEREASLSRLRDQLGVKILPDGEKVGPADFYWEHYNESPQHVWSNAIRRWAISTGAAYCLVLEDDIEVAPRFWPILLAMIEGAPGKMIGLHTRHPEAQILARAGKRWCSSTELVGTGYLMPRADLVACLKWFDGMGEAWRESITQDTAVGRWAYETRRRIYHPIPTLIDHDSSIESSLGADHDEHEGRNPTVTWKDSWRGNGAPGDLSELELPAFWRVGLETAPHLVIAPDAVRLG